MTNRPPAPQESGGIELTIGWKVLQTQRRDPEGDGVTFLLTHDEARQLIRGLMETVDYLPKPIRTLDKEHANA